MLHQYLSSIPQDRWRIRRWQQTAERIVSISDELASLNDAELTAQALDLRWQAYSAARLAKLLPQAYGLVREASRRVHHQAHFTVQLAAGIALYAGGVVEMQTGEGKTLTAVLPAFLHALPGHGCHVVTANDYLAQRDADFARPIFERLGLTVGCVYGSLEPDQRRAAYDCDVTYGTSREFGFDFLRDRLIRDGLEFPSAPSADPTAQRPEGIVQRGQHFALVDEADSVLIDDARTPLLIAAAEANNPVTEKLYRWCARAARELVQELDFKIDAKARRVRLTEHGGRSILSMTKPPGIDALDLERVCRQIEHALVAEHLFQLNRDYVFTSDGVGIVDESTGRVSDGRKWQDGLHQAVEAKEGIAISDATRTAARITVQSYFRRYAHLAGLTGTARNSRHEFQRIFRLRVVTISTRRPCLRKGLPPRVFVSQAAKYQSIADEIQRRLEAGQAVLIGTPSVAASESLSRVLAARGLDHQVLNCRHHQREAEVVSQAGERGRVSIATNMAGRGTDIHVTEEVLRAGGLHIIATEMHSNARIDRQLIGRTARQGEPGTFQFFLSLEDELFQGTKTRIAAARRQAKPDNNGELPATWLAFFRRTQRSLEARHQRQRKRLLKQEQQRDRLCRDMGLDPLLETLD